MRKIIYSIVLVCMLGALAYPFINVDQAVSITTIEKTILPYVDKQTMKKQDHNYIRRCYQTNEKEYEAVDSFASISAMNVNEITVFKGKDQDQINLLKKHILKHQETQLKSFEGYGVKQTELLNKAVVLEKGDYIFFIVHQKVSKIKQAIIDLF
ncbi:MAG: DUF4358 domain-containing protein [Erysipelotrichaceae bacterium]